MTVSIGLVLVLLVAVALWSSSDEPEPQPVFVQPAATAEAPSVSPEPVPSSPSPTPSASPSPSVTAETTARPTTVRPTTTAPRRTTPPAVTGEFEAEYVITRSGNDEFQAGVQVTNTGRTAEPWKVRVVHDPDAGVRVTFTFNATASSSGSTTVFSGGPLDAGDSLTFGFQASKEVGGVVRPTSCTVGGRACAVTVAERRRGYRNEVRARTR